MKRPTSPSTLLYMDDPWEVGRLRLLSWDTVKAAGGGLLPWAGVLLGVFSVLFIELLREVLDSAFCISSLPCAVAGRNEFRNS